MSVELPLNSTEGGLQNLELGQHTPVNDITQNIFLDNGERVYTDSQTSNANAVPQAKPRGIFPSEIPILTAGRSNTPRPMDIFPSETPTLTAGGLDHQLAVVSDRSDRLLHRIKKQIIILKQLLASCNIDMVNEEMANLDQMFFDYVDVNTRMLELAPGIPDAENCITTMDEVIFELKKDVATWLSDAEEKISRRSRASSRSSSTSSRKSIASSGAASRKSVKSNNSDVSMCPIQNKAHMAGLMAEKNGVKDRFGAELEKEIELLKQRKDAEMQSKLLELENEITVSKVKQAIFDNNDNTFVNATRRKG